MNVTKYSAPPSKSELSFSHTSLWTRPSSLSAFLDHLLGKYFNTSFHSHRTHKNQFLLRCHSQVHSPNDLWIACFTQMTISPIQEFFIGQVELLTALMWRTSLNLPILNWIPSSNFSFSEMIPVPTASSLWPPPIVTCCRGWNPQTAPRNCKYDK